jgi:23S rRNA (pseudouridine1915-N3)-methyltransferase
MQRITLLTIGTPRAVWARDGVAEYTERIEHAVRFDVVSLPASKVNDPQRQREEESQRILDALADRSGQIWVLDERGKQMPSLQFADAISGSRDRGEGMTFVIGGAYGLTDAVRTRADRVFALSAMTLPHELCQLLFVEQLYRATQIMKGSRYHHAD